MQKTIFQRIFFRILQLLFLFITSMCILLLFSLKKEDTLTRAMTWMSLGDTTLSEAGLALRTNAVMILILGSPDPGHRHRGRR